MILARHESVITLLCYFRRVVGVLALQPTFVSSIPARWKKFVSVGPGCSAVTVIPLSFSSCRRDCEKDNPNAFEAP